jgi:DNA polymerase III subunit delta'
LAQQLVQNVVFMFDYKLSTQAMPTWIDAALTQVLSAPNFPQSLGQTVGISDPHCAGGSRYALALAHALLCSSPSVHGRACGVCSQCSLMRVGNHPDLMCLVPEVLQTDFVPEKDKKPSKGIKAEQLRALENNFTLSSQRGGRKVVLIYPAETLGTVPANALLKTLEEPPLNTFFIVVSELWSQVLPTIRSRCVVQTLSEPTQAAKVVWLDTQQVPHPKRWLELAAGRVDKALNMAQDPLWMPLLKLMPYLLQGARTDAMGLANDMSKAELKRVVEALTLWMVDVLAVGQGASARFFAAQTPSMLQTIERMDIERAAQFAAQLSQMARVAEHPLSTRTQCEALLLEYKAIFN